MDIGTWAGLAGLIAAAVSAYVAFRKVGPESNAIVVDSAVRVGEFQREELQRLYGRLEELSKEVESLRERLDSRDIELAQALRDATRYRDERDEARRAEDHWRAMAAERQEQLEALRAALESGGHPT